MTEPQLKTLEQKLAAVQFPNGPEDKIIASYGFTWDQLKDFANRHTDWPLASKLAACVIELGLACEHQVGRAVFWEDEATEAKRYQDAMEDLKAGCGRKNCHVGTVIPGTGTEGPCTCAGKIRILYAAATQGKTNS